MCAINTRACTLDDTLCVFIAFEIVRMIVFRILSFWSYKITVTQFSNYVIEQGC